jgi:hypothetical protein
MTNPRDPEGLMPEADVTGGPHTVPEPGAGAPSPFEDAAEAVTGADPLADRTDTDEFGSDPDMRFPGDSEDPQLSTADATANARHVTEDGR